MGKYHCVITGVMGHSCSCERSLSGEVTEALLLHITLLLLGSCIYTQVLPWPLVKALPWPLANYTCHGDPYLLTWLSSLNLRPASHLSLTQKLLGWPWYHHWTCFALLSGAHHRAASRVCESTSMPPSRPGLPAPWSLWCSWSCCSLTWCTNCCWPVPLQNYS